MSLAFCSCVLTDPRDKLNITRTTKAVLSILSTRIAYGENLGMKPKLWILVKIVKSARICVIWSKSWNNLNLLKEISISLKNKIGMCFCYQTELSLECDIISQFYISWYLLDGHQVPRKLPWLYTRKTGENKTCKSLSSRSFLYFLALQSISPCRVSSPTRPEIIPGSWLIRSRLCQRVEWCFPQCNGIVMLMLCCINPVVVNSRPFQSIIMRNNLNISECDISEFPVSRLL